MNFWKIQNNQVQNAELQLYGEISNDDFSWWDGRQYITSKKFLEDIETIKNKKEITIKLNSGGGDLFVGLQIANVLRGISAKKICFIECISASAATLIVYLWYINQRQAFLILEKIKILIKFLICSKRVKIVV